MRITKYDLKMDENLHPVLVKECSTNYTKENYLNSPEKIANMVNDIFDLKNMAEERVFMIALNIKAKITGVFEVSKGTCDSSIINSKSIFTRAILSGATQFILCHNHPSGNISPSVEDFKITQKLINNGNMMDIPMADHIVVGRNGYYSFKEQASDLF